MVLSNLVEMVATISKLLLCTLWKCLTNMAEDMSNCPTEIRHAWEDGLSALCPLEGAESSSKILKHTPHMLALLYCLKPCKRLSFLVGPDKQKKNVANHVCASGGVSGNYYSTWKMNGFSFRTEESTFTEPRTSSRFRLGFREANIYFLHSINFPCMFS